MSFDYINENQYKQIQYRKQADMYIRTILNMCVKSNIS